MRIGIITAMAEETLPIYQKIGNIVSETVIGDVTIRQIVYRNNTVYLATCGIGEIRAAMTVQQLIDLYDIEAVFNFGFVGALNPELNVGELVIAERVCHHQFDIRAVEKDKLPGQYDGKNSQYFYLDENLLNKIDKVTGGNLKKVTVASGDKFVASSEYKRYLRETFGADICEMELAAIAIVAERNGIPAFSMKVISDRADEKATVSFEEVLQKGITNYEKTIPQILGGIK